MKVAVVGSGIAGLVTAYLLGKEHEVHLFEKNEYLGGHTNTRIVRDRLGREVSVDTGFIVCNPKNYPNFFKLMEELGVTLQKSEMSFGFADTAAGFSYLGPSIAEFSRMPLNFLRPRALRFIFEQRRFNRGALRDLRSGALGTGSLGEYLRSRKTSRFLLESYITPLISSIWSSPELDTESFPALTFVTFFDNHSMLNFRGRPQWYTVSGGSHTYVRALEKRFRGMIHLDSPVLSVDRRSDGVTVSSSAGNFEADSVVFACHADQALRLLKNPSDSERKLLGAWRYSKNLAVLHSDERVLPFPKRHWASWNYVRDGRAADEGVAITYYMNRLQRLDTGTDFFVTLNPRDAIDPEKVYYQTEYEHPVYTPQSVETQRELQKIQGENRSYYCGAHLGFGFHEDGVRAALDVARHFGAAL